jgi:hypothetical protein
VFIHLLIFSQALDRDPEVDPDQEVNPDQGVDPDPEVDPGPLHMDLDTGSRNLKNFQLPGSGSKNMKLKRKSDSDPFCNVLC